MNTRKYLLVYINSRRYEISKYMGFMSLSNFLRCELGLVGTKVVCAEGDCGSCTVLLGRYKESVIDYETIDSCITYMYQIDCSHVITVEGLENENQELHPVQKLSLIHI